ncbi:MAG: hypothetical protein J6Y16_10245 [Treponema sp.]|nr:hypothetical protein [Treponema sp.]
MDNQMYRLIAPDIDRLLNAFDRGHMNPSGITQATADAMDPIFEALSFLTPLKSNNEAKAIWLLIPRGNISDYDSFEYLKECEIVETHEDYEQRWQEDYPLEKMWYRLVIVEEKNREGITEFRGVAVGNKTILSKRMKEKGSESFSDEAAITLCKLILPAVKESIGLLKDGTYNNLVKSSLPYKFRTGVIKRSVLWKYDSDYKEFVFDGLSEETISSFRKLIESGINDKAKISRIKCFTANDFFKACVSGYKDLGYDTEGKSPAELYLKYADGRDEGLTGEGYNDGPGIDFDDSKAWDEWYFGERCGGHPWEIIRGGNSTHVDLYVCHDKNNLEYQFRLEKINEKEYKSLLEKSGYYFSISGKHRPMEAVTFYTALSKAGLPVILDDAAEILSRFDGSDYMGIVPHSVIPKYCEEMFPKEFGRVIDFIHVYDEEMEKFGKEIIWIPEDEACLANDV